MKIGILTFHCAHNYGAMLQAYALCTYINNLGHQCEVIDYRPEYLYCYYDRINFTQLYHYFRKNDHDSKLKAFLKALKYYKRRCYKDKRWILFNTFLTEKIKKSKNIYKNEEELTHTQYNIYICGSDQVWNTFYTKGIRPEFFCSFAKGKINTKCITYAASNGKSQIPNNELDITKKLLIQFQAISIREEGLKNFFKKNLNIPSTLVCDPVFLLNKSEWESLLIRPTYHNYLLIYTFDEDDTIYQVALEYAKKYKLHIVQITDKKRKRKGIIQETILGPQDFLGYIFFADYICTSSFHGTAFSIIFNKQFLCFPHKKFGERTHTLLKSTNLLSRNIYSNNQQLPKDIDYHTIEPLLNDFINKSRNFLKENLQ